MTAPTFDYGVAGILRVNLTYRGCSIDFLTDADWSYRDPAVTLADLERVAHDAIGPCGWTCAANGATYANDDAPGVRHIVFASHVPVAEES